MVLYLIAIIIDLKIITTLSSSYDDYLNSKLCHLYSYNSDSIDVDILCN